MTVCGLVLAAGAGRRMGGPKALVEVDGEPLVLRAVRLLRDGGCDDVVVVVGAQADDVVALLPDVETVRCDGWAEGMGASLREGLRHLGAGPHDACVVALVDQPLLGSAAVARLLGAQGAARVATYEGAPRNPVLLERAVWEDVAAVATGDTGARVWLAAHPDLVTGVPCDDTGSPVDIDTPDDLRALEHPALEAPA
ncbi:MAG: hypothetical protein JWM64_2278 [Frankiales bacterium]|nr:hypothetical protein [Frankiales bacterium]